jgi:hypothetical protein
MFNIASFLPFVIGKQKQVIVTFTGGMGAQILSAAIYFSIRNSGKEAYADLSYFDKLPVLATEGEIGQISQWNWQLDPFGLQPHHFETHPGKNTSREDVIVDGPRKIQLGLSSLQNRDIQKNFTILRAPVNCFGLNGIQYICVHIRRGDYINVATHLIPDEEFLNIANKFSSLCSNVVIVSDSTISPELKNRFSAQFKTCIFLDDIDALTTHYIMRNAAILICSNSQFSLVTGTLNESGLVLIPKNWGDADGIAETVSLFGNFQTLYS